ncbi:uncharacterized protein ARMOST_06288 [Armillaria ostoyae]|uniref:Uncharacterized protein n=1 Tax=Armillaria ostoyae TaxID=47428 RepID=A0A284R2M5_ARMOS|nr:uncharacterized protein ARMOST_06288 [Armillaria ostoyae]
MTVSRRSMFCLPLTCLGFGQDYSVETEAASRAWDPRTSSSHIPVAAQLLRVDMVSLPGARDEAGSSERHQR